MYKWISLIINNAPVWYVIFKYLDRKMSLFQLIMFSILVLIVYVTAYLISSYIQKKLDIKYDKLKQKRDLEFYQSKLEIAKSVQKQIEIEKLEAKKFENIQIINKYNNLSVDKKLILILIFLCCFRSKTRKISNFEKAETFEKEPTFLKYFDLVTDENYLFENRINYKKLYKNSELIISELDRLLLIKTKVEYSLDIELSIEINSVIFEHLTALYSSDLQ